MDPLGEAGRHSGYLEMAQLVASDPDVIAIMPCGFDIDRAWREMPALVDRPEWQQSFAVLVALGHHHPPAVLVAVEFLDDALATAVRTD